MRYLHKKAYQYPSHAHAALTQKIIFFYNNGYNTHSKTIPIATYSCIFKPELRFSLTIRIDSGNDDWAAPGATTFSTLAFIHDVVVATRLCKIVIAQAPAAIGHSCGTAFGNGLIIAAYLRDKIVA